MKYRFSFLFSDITSLEARIEIKFFARFNNLLAVVSSQIVSTRYCLSAIKITLWRYFDYRFLAISPIHFSFFLFFLFCSRTLSLDRSLVPTKRNRDKEGENRHRFLLLSISMVLRLCDIGWTCKTCAISREIARGRSPSVPPLLPLSAPSPSLQPLVFFVGWPVNRKRYKPRPRFWESSTPLALYSNHDNRNTDPGDLHHFWKISLIPLPRIARFHLLPILLPSWFWKGFAILQNYNVSCMKILE